MVIHTEKKLSQYYELHIIQVKNIQMQKKFCKILKYGLFLVLSN